MKDEKDLEIVNFNDDDEFDIEMDADIEVETEPELESSEKPSVIKEILGWIIPFAIAIVAVILLKNYVIINATVPTGSMEPTIMVNDNLFGFRLAYKIGEPKRGDVVIFPAPDKENEKYIKRIIGLPGETVTIKDGKVYIDGNLLEEDYIVEDWSSWNGAYEDPSTVHTYEVPEGCYFMMGDNRNNSSDARLWRTTDKQTGELYTSYPGEEVNVHLGSDSDPIKFVKKEDIIGKAMFIYWPLAHFGGL